jgi:hypothetical protein
VLERKSGGGKVSQEMLTKPSQEPLTKKAIKHRPRISLYVNKGALRKMLLVSALASSLFAKLAKRETS